MKHASAGKNRLNRFILNLALHRWLGQMTSRGPFQPKLSYDPINFRYKVRISLKAFIKLTAYLTDTCLLVYKQIPCLKKLVL